MLAEWNCLMNLVWRVICVGTSLLRTLRKIFKEDIRAVISDGLKALQATVNFVSSLKVPRSYSVHNNIFRAPDICYHAST